LRYLEKGSEKSFRNFCEALKEIGQEFLVNLMNQKTDTFPQQPCSHSEAKPAPGSQLVAPSSELGTGVPCSEQNLDGTKTSLTEIAPECTQGLLLIAI